MHFEKPESLGDRFRTLISVLGWLVALMWIAECIDHFFLGQALNRYGVRPRQVNGLVGIPAAPFLHGDFQHLIANTVPLFIFGGLVSLRSINEFFNVSFLVVLVSGLGIWLIGDGDSVHIGASGLIFGLFGYLLLLGFFERTLSAVLVTVLVGLAYGGLIWGVLPQQDGISWEAHLFGFLGGAAAAKMFARQRQGSYA